MLFDLSFDMGLVLIWVFAKTRGVVKLEDSESESSIEFSNSGNASGEIVCVIV